MALLTDHQQSIIDLATNLYKSGIQEGHDGLSSVDGQFYWHICRKGDRERIKVIVDHISNNHHEHKKWMDQRSSIDPSSREFPTEKEKERALAYLDDLKKLTEIEADLVTEVPNFSEWIHDGRPPMMRDRTFRWWQGGSPFGKSHKDGWLQLGVTSSGWNGFRVEHEFKDCLSRILLERPDETLRLLGECTPQTNMV
ncbi:MAG: hypothetical protein WKF81_11780 [Thermomicrobiales bacterium]